MGNSIWVCKYCDFPNYGSPDVCMKCLKNRNTGLLTRSISNIRDLSYKTLYVDKANTIRLNLNQKASQTATKINTSKSYVNHFIDNEFPPIKSSLFMDGNKIKRSNLIHSNGFRQVKKWLRPHEIAVSVEDSFMPVSLFSDPSPKDVIQGELGTCWFLSALALLAEKPFLLLNCMISQVYNSQGHHQVRLCRRGEWVIVNIDDYLPCDKANQLVFSYGRKRQFWVPFMEKALAKLYGSYEAVARGACAEGLQTLTGEPCEVIYLQLTNTKPDINGLSYPMGYHDNSPYYIWKKILYSRQLGYLMTTLCFNENLRYDAFDKVGLLSRHIYSILDAREFENNGMPVQLIRLSKIA
jgi:calpain-15